MGLGKQATEREVHGADPRPVFLTTPAFWWVLVATTTLEVPQVQNSGFGSQFYYLCSLSSSSSFSIICAPRLLRFPLLSLCRQNPIGIKKVNSLCATSAPRKPKKASSKLPNNPPLSKSRLYTHYMCTYAHPLKIKPRMRNAVPFVPGA